MNKILQEFREENNMKDIADFRLKEFSRLMEWIAQNPDSWDRVIVIMNNNEDVIDETFVDVLRQLAENEFYQILFVLFQSNNFYISEAVKMAVFMPLTVNIEKDALDNFTQLVIDNFIKLKADKM